MPQCRDFPHKASAPDCPMGDTSPPGSKPVWKMRFDALSATILARARHPNRLNSVCAVRREPPPPIPATLHRIGLYLPCASATPKSGSHLSRLPSIPLPPDEPKNPLPPAGFGQKHPEPSPERLTPFLKSSYRIPPIPAIRSFPFPQ